MRRPRLTKTRKSVARRFKITANGKVMRNHAGKRHLLRKKDARHRRRLGSEVQIDPSDAKRIKKNLPFGAR